MKAYNLKEHILFEDESIIVCYKPAGLAVQNAKVGRMDLESMLRNYLASKMGGRQMPYLAVIHRLDQPVEGILVFAKTQDAARMLNQQLTSYQMKKEYLAVVKGVPKEKEAVLIHELEKDTKTNSSRVVKKKTSQSKRAELSYCLEKTIEETSLLRIVLKTGRHHQIRVQLSHMGMPLIGDNKYNPDVKEVKMTPALCAAKLSFLHPKTKKQLTFTVCPCGEIFQKFFD